MEQSLIDVLKKPEEQKVHTTLLRLPTDLKRAIEENASKFDVSQHHLCVTILRHALLPETINS